MPIKIFTVAEMIAAEKAANAAGHSYAAMMEIAGRNVAQAIMDRVTVADKRVLILVGPGNNGGDGLAAGRYLAEAGADVAFYLYKSRDPEQDPHFAKVRKMGLFIAEAGLDQRYRVLRTRLVHTDILVDALLGTGVSRPIGGELAKLMKIVRATLSSPLPFIAAVDCPSGLNCDTGALDALAIPADLTVTFAGPKRGHFIFPGAAACGELVTAEIGIDPALPVAADVKLELATAVLARQLLPPRPPDGHKGTFGTAVICAGSGHYWGAPMLAGKAAYRAGAGLVALAVPEKIRATVAGQLPEATYPPVAAAETLDGRSLSFLLETVSAKAMLAGPGLDQAADFIVALLAADHLPPLVVDADGLNLLAQIPGWQGKLPPHTILTPHPGEMARLMDMPLAEIKQMDRVALAQEQAAAWGHVVLLKGAYTVVAAADGRTHLLPFANPALGAAGSGDILAGTIVGLLAQGMEPYEAAVLGGYLHGAAASLYAGSVGLLAGELADLLPEAIRGLSTTDH